VTIAGLFHCQITRFDTEYYKPKWDGGTLTNLIDNYITHMYIYMYISKIIYTFKTKTYILLFFFFRFKEIIAVS